MKFLLIFLSACLFVNTPSAEHNLSEEEIKVLIEEHNRWRSEVGVQDIEWSDELAKVAADWAKELKNQGCAFKHSRTKYGENLFTGTTGYYHAKDVTDSWGGEKADYNYTRNTCKPGKMCGHYTQMVWKTTTKVGCAKINCDGMTTWVCNYDPPGNYIGRKPY
ncbi:MAG: CAP domain-containing protein [Cyclobacteriaceae bacterium]